MSRWITESPRHKLLEEDAGHDCARRAVSDILEIRDIALKVFEINIPEGKGPELSPGLHPICWTAFTSFSRFPSLRRLVAEGDYASPGECGNITRRAAGSAEHRTGRRRARACFGIRADYLDVSPDRVRRTSPAYRLCLPACFPYREDTYDPPRESQSPEDFEETENCRRTRHILLHRFEFALA